MSWIACGFIGLGLFFGIMGNVGVLRFPDVYTRIHAACKCSTTSVLSILVGCMLLEGFTPMTARILVITLFFLITSPVAGHIVGRSAWARGLAVWRRPREERSAGPEETG